MAPCPDHSEELIPNETLVSCCCAFLCDLDGRILRDFGEQLPFSAESISARSLVSQIKADSLMDFLKSVRARAAIQERKIRIHFGGSAGSLYLLGSPTPLGILVFATLMPVSATGQGGRPAASANTGRHTATAANRKPLMNPGEDTASLLAVAVHDLRNPISTIVSSCEYLTGYSPENLNPEQLEMIAGIEASARSLLELSFTISRLCRPKFPPATDDAEPPAEDKSGE